MFSCIVKCDKRYQLCWRVDTKEGCDTFLTRVRWWINKRWGE